MNIGLIERILIVMGCVSDVRYRTLASIKQGHGEKVGGSPNLLASTSYSTDNVVGVEESISHVTIEWRNADDAFCL